MLVESLPLWAIGVLFLTTAVVIAVAGTALTHYAVDLARATGLGEATFGALFVGGVTSIPGIVTTTVAAAWGHAELAASNAIGGIAAQTVFLALADVFHRRANLEHAAASMANLVQGATLVALLAVPLLAAHGPPITLWGVHPASLLLLVGYVLGMRLASNVRAAPMWQPRMTPETYDEPRTAKRGRTRASWSRFVLLAAVVAATGYVLADLGVEAAERTRLSETTIGGYLTAIATSIPELVLAVAAVRHGALNLAVGDVIGGNCFDVLFLSIGDVAFRGGSLYHAIGQSEMFLVALTILMTAVLILGLLRREKHGIANIGFESFFILVVYAASSVVIVAR